MSFEAFSRSWPLAAPRVHASATRRDSIAVVVAASTEYIARGKSAGSSS